MSTPIEFISTEGPGSLPAPASAQAPKKGDFGFAAILDAAGAAEGAAEERSLPSSVTAYNSLNLLNGRFPPPDSGAGFIFTVVSLQQDDTY